MGDGGVAENGHHSEPGKKGGKGGKGGAPEKHHLRRLHRLLTAHGKSFGKVLPLPPPEIRHRKMGPKKWGKSAREGHRKGAAIPPAQSCPLGSSMGKLGAVPGRGGGVVSGGQLQGDGGVAENWRSGKLKNW